MSRSSRRTGLLPLGILAAGCALTLAAWWATRREIRRADQARFDRLGESVALALEERLRSNERGLQGIRALFAASEEVERGEFRQYAASLDLEDFPGVWSFSFVRAVPREGLDAFLRKTRAMGEPGFALRRPAPGPWHYVVEYLEPTMSNPTALGLDLATEAERRQAAELARDSGRAVLTHSIRLHADTLPGPAFVLFLPIYAGGSHPADLAARRAAHIGWAAAPIRMKGFLAGIEAETGGLAALELRERQEDGRLRTLFSSLGRDHAGPALAGSTTPPWSPPRGFATHRVIRMAERSWVLDMRSLPAFEAGAGRALAPFILWGGALVSLLAAGLASLGERSRRRAVELARRMTRSLRESEESWKFALEGAGDGVWDYFPEEGRLVYSAKGRRMLGYGADEAFGTTLEAWLLRVHPDDVGLSLEAFRRHARGESEHYECELRLRCKDGSWKWVLDRGKVIRWRAPGHPQRVIGIHQDITAMREGAQRLQETLALQATLLRNAPHGIVSVDAQGLIRIWNVALERMVGYRAEEVVGLRTTAILHDPAEVAARAEELTLELGEPVAPGLDVFTAKARRGKVDEREWTLVRKDGSRFPALFSVAAVRGSDGGITGYQGMVIDLTARKQAEEALRLAKAAAERADRAKSEFLAYMSHEIRTPIHGVLGITSLLARTPLSPEQKEHVRTIASSGEMLLRLVNDILDYSRIEAGMLALESRDFDALAACREVLDLLRARAADKGLGLALEADGPEPLRVRADQGRFRQIVFNLVGNAIKFTDRGGVALRVRPARQAAGDAGAPAEGVLFEVRDTGAGVLPERRHLLFRRFTQADSNLAGRQGGTGLGLSISKSLAEMMGGAIGHRDGEGGGSVFWFTLPAAATAPAPEPPPAPRAAADAPPPASARPRVLVVDDNAINRKVALGMLQALDCPAEAASGAAEALERLDREAFDLVLMDCEMPGMNGFEATREIRAREAATGGGAARPRIPVIALTANAMAENRQRCLAAGMDGYLAKPFALGELRELVGRHGGPGAPASARENTGAA